MIFIMAILNSHSFFDDFATGSGGMSLAECGEGLLVSYFRGPQSIQSLESNPQQMVETLHPKPF